MEKLISISILVPEKDIEIHDVEVSRDAGDRYYPPTININTDQMGVSIDNLDYEIEDFDEAIISKLAVDRYIKFLEDGNEED